MKKLLKEDIYDIVNDLEDGELGEIAKAINPEVQLKNGFAVPEHDDYTKMQFTSSFGKIFIKDYATQAISEWGYDDSNIYGDGGMYQKPICKINGTEIPLVESEYDLCLFQDKAFTIVYETASEGRTVVLVAICETKSLSQPTLEEKRAYRRGYLKGLREASKKVSK